jgi:probable HAF family extracellular repeat protein
MRFKGVVALFVCGISQVVYAVPLRYSVTDLGPGDYSVALNNRGEAVGYDGDYFSTEYPAYAYLWSVEKRLSLGALGPPYVGWVTSEATGINDYGQIVGATMMPEGAFGAFLFDENGMRSLKPMGGANDINNRSQVVGIASFGGQGHAAMWDAGELTELVTFSHTYSNAFAVNEHGDATGHWETEHATPDGWSIFNVFYYHDGHVVDLGSPSGLSAGGLDINNAGDIVGDFMGPDGASHAFLYRDGFHILDPPDDYQSIAESINDAGLIVGTYTSGYFFYACLWLDGVRYDLNNLIPPETPYTLEWAKSINERGEILVNAWNEEGYHVLLLNPVPESGTLSFAAIAFMTVVGWHCCRRKQKTAAD